VKYHVPSVLRLRGGLRVEGLEWALQEVINRMKVLRTVIKQEEAGRNRGCWQKNSWRFEDDRRRAV